MKSPAQGHESSGPSWEGDAEATLRAYVEPSSAPGLLPRSTRFPIETTIRYRERGNSHWHDGHTLNISGSGVLFEAGQVPAPGIAVEMIFTLPAQGRNYSGGQVACLGEVVRTARSSDRPCVAATIVRYRLAPKF